MCLSPACLESIASLVSSISTGSYRDSSSKSFLNWAFFLLMFSGLTTETKNWHNFQMCELITFTIMNKETKTIKKKKTSDVCVSLCAWCLWRSNEDIQYPENGSYELPCGCWELKLVLWMSSNYSLTIKPSLQSYMKILLLV